MTGILVRRCLPAVVMAAVAFSTETGAAGRQNSAPQKTVFGFWGPETATVSRILRENLKDSLRSEGFRSRFSEKASIDEVRYGLTTATVFFADVHARAGTNPGLLLADGRLVTPAEIEGMLDGKPGPSLVIIVGCGSGGSGFPEAFGFRGRTPGRAFIGFNEKVLGGLGDEIVAEVVSSWKQTGSGLQEAANNVIKPGSLLRDNFRIWGDQALHFSDLGKPPVAPTVTTASVLISPTTIALPVGGAATFTASVVDEDGRAVRPTPQLVWRAEGGIALEAHGTTADVTAVREGAGARVIVSIAGGADSMAATVTIGGRGDQTILDAEFLEDFQRTEAQFVEIVGQARSRIAQERDTSREFVKGATKPVDRLASEIDRLQKLSRANVNRLRDIGADLRVTCGPNGPTVRVGASSRFRVTDFVNILQQNEDRLETNLRQAEQLAVACQDSRSLERAAALVEESKALATRIDTGLNELQAQLPTTGRVDAARAIVEEWRKAKDSLRDAIDDLARDPILQIDPVANSVETQHALDQFIDDRITDLSQRLDAFRGRHTSAPALADRAQRLQFHINTIETLKQSVPQDLQELRTWPLKGLAERATRLRASVVDVIGEMDGVVDEFRRRESACANQDLSKEIDRADTVMTLAALAVQQLGRQYEKARAACAVRVASSPSASPATTASASKPIVPGAYLYHRSLYHGAADNSIFAEPFMLGRNAKGELMLNPNDPGSTLRDQGWEVSGPYGDTASLCAVVRGLGLESVSYRSDLSGPTIECGKDGPTAAPRAASNGGAPRTVPSWAGTPAAPPAPTGGPPPVTPPVDPLQRPDPWNDAQVKALMTDWLARAVPLEGTPGNPMHYNEWAQPLSAAARSTAPPDHSGTKEQYLWERRTKLTSTELCTLGEFVERRLKNESLASCRPSVVASWAGGPSSSSPPPSATGTSRSDKAIEAARGEVKQTEKAEADRLAKEKRDAEEAARVAREARAREQQRELLQQKIDADRAEAERLKAEEDRRRADDERQKDNGRTDNGSGGPQHGLAGFLNGLVNGNQTSGAVPPRLPEADRRVLPDRDCEAIVGKWIWSDGSPLTVSSSRAFASSKDSGGWFCDDREPNEYTFTWSVLTDHLRLSADGTRLTGTDERGRPVSARLVARGNFDYPPRDGRVVGVQPSPPVKGPPPVQPPRAVVTHRFDRPKTKGGYPLDYCTGFAVGCGQPAADAFCRAEGYTSAQPKGFADEKSPEPTQILKTGGFCDPKVGCGRFTWIVCERR